MRRRRLRSGRENNFIGRERGGGKGEKSPTFNLAKKKEGSV